ncbi:AAA family ATPase [Candidatus Pacearchaeota archaeon CG10_big_fil_rev_8_21_14_0_10_35_13]|nr:MAG: AAA family ATPase [Candidatus Pacearchaeota archaeon CG10_big_fil_rev_8_21_14_0_10_35_13]
MFDNKRTVYVPQGDELDIAVACHRLQLPLMLRGPTGIGKTTFVYYLSSVLNKPLVEEVCTEDTLAADLVGRRLPDGWVDGSATSSLRHKDGAVYYLDELGEARPNAMTVVHSLTDDRRTLDVRVNGEVLRASDDWMLISSYNPLYQLQNNVKPSTAQRFITLDIPFPESELEERIVSEVIKGDSLITENVSVKKYKNNGNVPINKLVKLANDYRRLAQSAESVGLREGPGTRLVVRTAKLIGYGLSELRAIEVGMINPLTYDSEQKVGMTDIARKLFR